MENVNRKDHFENLLVLIDKCSVFSEENFETLLSKIEEEARRETTRLSNNKKNSYLHNLKQTLEKQVVDYKEAIPNYKQVEYFRFLKAFREDVKDELERMKKYG